MDKKTKTKSGTIYTIVQGIQQAAYNAQDHPSGGTKTDVLKREEGESLKDSRVIDGFSVKVAGDILKITYSSVIQLEKALEKNMESELEKMVNDLSSFLKKEFKSITGDTLTLTKQGEVKIEFQNVSNVKTFVKACGEYKVGGLESSSNDKVNKERKTKVDKIEKLEEKRTINFDRFKKII